MLALVQRSTTSRIAHIDLSLEPFDRLHRSGGDDHHSSSYFLALHTTQQSAHVVSSFTTVELLMEHLDASQSGLEVGAETNNLNVRAFGDDTSLNTSSG